MNRSEEFVSTLCEQTFFSLWSYPNPKRDAGSNKELCDVLVVCDPDVIVFSVKEIQYKGAKAPDDRYLRWLRKAVEQSVAQIYGAERRIAIVDRVITVRSEVGLQLPDKKSRRIHRVAIAIGSNGKISIPSGNFGGGFVHVMDEKSFFIIINELDTISDFVEYLKEKENFIQNGHEIMVEGGEEDLMAIYLRENRAFPKDANLLVEKGAWESLVKNPSYQAKKREDKISYLWDRIIQFLAETIIDGTMLYTDDKDMSEKGIRIMARESRLSRRMSARAFESFLRKTGHKARIHLSSLRPVTYVFFALPGSEDREYRKVELGIRCCIARVLYPQNPTVIGLATETFGSIKGRSFDIFHFYLDKLNEEFKTKMLKARDEFQFFTHIKENRSIEDEYPSV